MTKLKEVTPSKPSQGLLPGDLFAGFGFSLDTAGLTNEKTCAYVDDVQIAGSFNELDRIAERAASECGRAICGPKTIKLKARETGPAGAAVLLGAIIEMTPKAAAAICNKKTKQFNTLAKAITGSKISKQCQLLLMKALERRMKYIFEVSEPHVVEQLAVNCNQILYTAYEAIFETSLLDAARRQLHCSYATGGLGVLNFVQDAPKLFRMATQRAVWFRKTVHPNSVATRSAKLSNTSTPARTTTGARLPTQADVSSISSTKDPNIGLQHYRRTRL
jgi:hypothetical protein